MRINLLIPVFAVEATKIINEPIDNNRSTRQEERCACQEVQQIVMAQLTAFVDNEAQVLTWTVRMHHEQALVLSYNTMIAPFRFLERLCQNGNQTPRIKRNPESNFDAGNMQAYFPILRCPFDQETQCHRCAAVGCSGDQENARRTPSGLCMSAE